MTRYWKVLNGDGRACHGGDFQYDLPKGGRPGKWTPRITDVVACERGYHLCRDEDVREWCSGATIWAAEARGKIVVADNKVVCESVRLVAPTPWDAVTARLFAVECAADVQHLMTDARSHAALEVAYRYALGDATGGELPAARDAAWAAWAAARDAARAAWDAAGGAAWAAARTAAWDAAWAAWDAAGDAAGGAAADAAWAATQSAARRRQTHRLLWWLGASDTYPKNPT